MNDYQIRHHAILSIILLAIMTLASGCGSLAGQDGTITPTVTLTRTATPDVYATSAQRTLVAMAGNSTSAAQTGTPLPLTATALAELSAEQTAGPSDGTSPADSTGEAAATTTVTTTPTASPTFDANQTPVPTTQNGRLIESFTAVPNEIAPGGAVTLTWRTTADRVTLFSITPRGVFGSREDVSPSGSMTVTTEAENRSPVRYALYAESGDLLESAMISVPVTCPDAWFFDNGPDTCPASTPILSGAAAQTFERGLMIWLAQLNRIYVLFNDSNSPRWRAFADPWNPALPDSDPNIIAPAGLVQPVRGFGMVWRGVGDEPDPTVRARLGWGLAPEFGLESAFQCDSALDFVTCYLLGPNGAVYRLDPEGLAWEILN